MPVEVSCYLCGKTFPRTPSLVRERNFCCREHQQIWVSEFIRTQINVPGHTAGTKKPWMIEVNREKNKNLWDKPGNRESMAAKRRGKGNKDTYTKYLGRHEHRVVAEQLLGRPLRKGEVVHHINGNKKDNRPENLMVFPSNAEHTRYHHRAEEEVIPNASEL